MIKLISAIHPYMNKNLAIYTLFSLYIDPPSRYLFKEKGKKITKNSKRLIISYLSFFFLMFLMLREYYKIDPGI